MEMRTFVCSQCGHRWQVPYGTMRPHACPQCGSADIHRAPEERGHGRRCRGRGKGRRNQ